MAFTHPAPPLARRDKSHDDEGLETHPCAALSRDCSLSRCWVFLAHHVARQEHWPLAARTSRDAFLRDRRDRPAACRGGVLASFHPPRRPSSQDVAAWQGPARGLTVGISSDHAHLQPSKPGPRFAFAWTILVLALGLLGPATTARAEISATDVTGRQIVLKEPARRILIDDGRYLIALSLLHPDPVSVLAAWPRDINRIGPAVYAQYAEKFPALETLKVTAARPASTSSNRCWRRSPILPSSR